MEVSDLRETEILAHLEDILASPAFCTSQRSSQFLRYVVESALAGEKDRLKERVIGERIFGRRADYDTGQDSIVRVKASEVRRRLAQYYDHTADTGLRIELPPGSYAPWFHGATSPSCNPASPRVRRPPRGTLRLWLILAAALVPLLARRGRAQRPSDSVRALLGSLPGSLAHAHSLPSGAGALPHYRRRQSLSARRAATPAAGGEAHQPLAGPACKVSRSYRKPAWRLAWAMPMRLP